MPFVGAEAIASGKLTARQLRMDYCRIHQGIYVRKGVELDARGKARAVALWAGDDGILGGRSAAAIHGSRWIEATEPAEVFRTGSRRSASGVIVHGGALSTNEICVIEGLRATTPARTAYDLGRRLPVDEAVAVLDALCRATALDPKAIAELAAAHHGARGLTNLRSVLDLVDAGAESPKETQLRLLVLRAGLPTPATQIPIVDEFGRTIARADLGWERWRVLLEYDGAQHWTDPAQRAWDIERTELLERLGWKIVRVSSKQLLQSPRTVVERVRRALRAAGAPI